jgi:DNA-binding transcriptional regulator YhcF (GntR family)
VSPRAQRSAPFHRQISDWFSERIAEGAPGFLPGDKLPPIREVARTWDVGFQAAQHAYGLLASAKLVESRGKLGTFVLAPRNVLGPEQRLRSTRFPAAERIEVQAAELIPAPDYIRPILGLPGAVSHVIRRQWRTFDSTGPFMLTVSWTSPRYSGDVPELLVPEPLPDPRGAAYLIAERAGLVLADGVSSREARRVLDDGREAPALELELADFILAETYTWDVVEPAGTVEYVEFIVRPNRVIVTSLAP